MSGSQLGGGGQLYPFAVGDPVQLSVGGPKMAVTAVHYDLVTCVWFEQALGPDGAFAWKGASTETFPASCLVPVTTDASEIQ